MVLETEADLQKAYQGDVTAARYVGERFTDELNRLLHDRQVAAVQRAADRLGRCYALEIAPGPGRLTRAVRVAGTLVCLEYNEGMIAQGRPASDPAVLWVRGNGFRLPFVTAFDLVYTFRFIRHFRRPDRERLYGEIRRVLNPGGFFVMDAVNERFSRPMRESHPEEYSVYDKLYTEDELRRELLQAGLEPLELTPVQKFYRGQSRSQVLLGPRANWLNRLVIRGLERLPRREGLEWIVTCRRV